MRAEACCPGASIGVLGLFVLLAIVVPASGATSDRSAIRMKALTSPHASAVAKDEDEGDGGDADEKEDIRERGLFEAAIAASPAAAVPSQGLHAAVAAANAAPGDGRQLERDHQAAVPQRPGQPRRQLRRRLGLRDRPDDRLHAAGGALYAGAASGGVWRTTDGGGTGPRSTAGCRGCRSARWRPIRATARCIVGTGEANNASENQYGVGAYRLPRGSEHLDARRRARAGRRRRSTGSRSINGYLYAATSHGLWRRAESASDSSRLAAWCCGPIPNPNNSPYRTSFITDVIAVPGTNGRQDPGRRRLGRLRRRSRRRSSTTGSTSAPAAAGSFHRITPQGDINPKTIGRTSFSTSQGWLYAVVQDTSTDSLYGQGAVPVEERQPGRAVDADRGLGPSWPTRTRRWTRRIRPT